MEAGRSPDTGREITGADKKEDILIRAFSTGDLEKCAVLYADIFGRPPWKEQWPFQKARDLIAGIIRKKTFMGFTAQYNGKAVGYLLGFRLGKIAPLSRVYYLNELFVDTAYQNRNVGRKLVDTLIYGIGQKGTDRIVLLTKQGTKAEKFYEKLGFFRLLPLAGPQGKILMQRRLGKIEMEAGYGAFCK